MLRFPPSLRLPIGLACTVVLAAGCSADPGPPADDTSASASNNGRSVVVLGHSGATGYNSDPADGSRDARGNSWATGTNPAVNSIYQRLQAQSPEYTGHNMNLAKDGATVDDLLGQAKQAAAAQPPAGIVLIQVVDNDIRCDGTDPDNYDPFAQTLRTALQTITQAAPQARIYMLSQWATVANYTETIADMPGGPEANTGTGPCDTFDANRRIRPKAVAYLQDVVDHYHQQLATVCAAFPTCTYDQGALQKMTLVPADLSPDLNHLSIDGHRKYAEHAWNALF
ncbi:GDSL-type esterase/lipase family protein [Phytohabitans sp. ZYX-F-186]|uniref:GDSL-type esterase/lipase family protein n=1 Tax=Phytohabitans maris TaxID=3071409 RepID=A0ABU0ZKM2_9ACTN|nr:GDSL-type esterase/lipase family protein [Phytohabitans sp. ZYX-F-186]MDQ7907601.1 GDSL-type esterase/lipase family protein [Phytohabitans sp. ZYX-F-186]